MKPYLTPMIPGELRPQIDRELQPGERVLWFAQPDPRLMRRGTWIVSIFGLVFMGFALVWILMTAGGAAAVGGRIGGIIGFGLFSLCGLPFLGVGGAMLTGPLWIGKRAARMAYVITDQRAIIWEAGWFGRLHVQSFGPERLASMTRSERADGSGDLIFEQFTTRAGTGVRTVRRGFLALPQVREAEQAVRDLLLKDLAR